MKKSRIVALGFAMTAAFAGATFAQGMADRGLYLGGSVGQAEAQGWCDTGGAAGVTLASCDDKDTAWKLFAGYKFNRYLALEGSYMNLGEFTASVTSGGVSANVTGEATSWNIAAVGMLPLGNQFSLFGKLGWAWTDAAASVTVGGTNVRVGEDDDEAIYGVGVQWDMTRNWALRAEWERLDKSEIDMLSIGVQFKF